MNPAFRIWGWALAACALVSIILSFNGGAAIYYILLLVAVVSLLSLLCFYLLFELLRLLRIAKLFFWINTVIGVPAIVAFNAWCFLAKFYGNIGNVWWVFRWLLPFALIPVTGALIGIAISHKQINAFCTHESTAYYPDSCI